MTKRPSSGETSAVVTYVHRYKRPPRKQRAIDRPGGRHQARREAGGAEGRAGRAGKSGTQRQASRRDGSVAG
jgi:hypothetical protein